MKVALCELINASSIILSNKSFYFMSNEPLSALPLFIASDRCHGYRSNDNPQLKPEINQSFVE